MCLKYLEIKFKKIVSRKIIQIYRKILFLKKEIVRKERKIIVKDN